MSQFATKKISDPTDVIAPDGSEVRLLCSLSGGSMAHFSLASGLTSTAVRHRTVEEIWYFIGGSGQMWRELNGREETVVVEPGVSITIPCGTTFQFRSTDTEPLCAVAITMPPWPGEGEAIIAKGPWASTPFDR